MPGKIIVRVLGARHLPIMDRASELTDAFVEIKFANQVETTFRIYTRPFCGSFVVARFSDYCRI